MGKTQAESSSSAGMSCLECLADGSAGLRLYVQPKASKSRIIGLHDGCLKVAVAAPPVDGKANKVVVKFLAKSLGLAPRDLAIKSGGHSRRKLVVLQGVSGQKVAELLRKILEN